ncbi:aminomethyl-transferring glycine dehydrogenase subunit GcvPA [Acidobacteriota bacterium]
MNDKDKLAHPYIPNSAPDVKMKMMKEIGITDIVELYEDIPDHLRFQRKLNLPDPIQSEYDLKCHVQGILSKNQTCEKNLSFLGGGCWQHYVPAICDEINQRSEFLTAYAGEPYEDHGRFQSLFEYQSLMAELLDMDVVNVPTYDWCQAAATTMRMAERLTGRKEVLCADTVSPERLSAIRNYCHPVMTVKLVKHVPETGLMDIQDLKLRISDETAGVYFENPSFLGCIEHQGESISTLAHENGSVCLVGGDPISLGVLNPPSHYGADIVCGDIQSLGMHMSYGSGQAGFIATRDEERYVMEYPSRLFGITRTSEEGEWGFGDVAYERTSFAEREHGKEFVGTHSALWGVTAAVYLSLLGPAGIQDIGKVILQKSQYAMKKLAGIKDVKAPRFDAAHFKEFVVDFNDTGMSVSAINRTLIQKGIFGGKDLSKEFPDLGECGLYCITEIHTKENIDVLCDVLEEIVTKKSGKDE